MARTEPRPPENGRVQAADVTPLGLTVWAAHLGFSRVPSLSEWRFGKATR